jgi:hypothetical protein
MTETDPSAREAEEMLEGYVASLQRLGIEELRDRFVTPDHRGRPNAGFPVTDEQIGPSGRIYQFETLVSLEGDDVHVFVSMFPDRKVRLVRNIDFVVRP